MFPLYKGKKKLRFSLPLISERHLQEKCKNANKHFISPLIHLYITFLYFTKDFDTVSRDGLFKLLAKIGCPPKPLGLKRSYHDGKMSAVIFNGTLSDWFDILN